MHDRGSAAGGAGLILGSALSFALMPVLGKVAYAEGASPLGLLSWRFAIAAVLLWAVVLIRRPVLPRPRQAASLLALGAFVLAGEVALYFFGLQHITAGLAEVLLFLFPAWVVVIASVAARRAPSALVATCTLVAVAGAAVCVGASIGGPGGGSPSGGDSPAGAAAVPGTPPDEAFLLGVGLLIAASIAYACYVVLAGAAVDSHGALVTTTLVVTGAAAAFVVASAATSSAMPGTPAGRWAAVGMAVVSTVLAFGLLSAGLVRLGATRAAVIATSEPVMAVLLGALVLGEHIGWAQAAGMAAVVVAIVIIVWRGGDGRAGGSRTDDGTVEALAVQ